MKRDYGYLLFDFDKPIEDWALVAAEVRLSIEQDIADVRFVEFPTEETASGKMEIHLETEVPPASWEDMERQIGYFLSDAGYSGRFYNSATGNSIAIRDPEQFFPENQE